MDNNSDLSDLTGKNNELATTMMTTTSASLGPMHPKPKRKQIRLTASAVHQRHADNLAAKRHKSDVHKAAVCLYKVEKQKPNGLSIRQVHAVITARYEVCPSIALIFPYVKQGLVNASPMKMGPVGRILAMGYKFLCQANSSLIPINQMNACAGDNSRKKMIPMLAKTFNIGTIKETELFKHVVCYMATDINAAKLNCAEDCCIRWTTFQKFGSVVDSWEVFVVEYGFETINTNGELHFEEKMKKRVVNLDETCLSLGGSNSNRGGCLTARLVIPAGILQIPVFSISVPFFSQESRFLFRRNFFGTP